MESVLLHPVFNYIYSNLPCNYETVHHITFTVCIFVTPISATRAIRMKLALWSSLGKLGIESFRLDCNVHTIPQKPNKELSYPNHHLSNFPIHMFLICVANNKECLQICNHPSSIQHWNLLFLLCSTLVVFKYSYTGKCYRYGKPMDKRRSSMRLHSTLGTVYY